MARRGVESSHEVLARLLGGGETGGVASIARLLDSAASSVAVFERTDLIRVAYLNASAAAQAAVAAEDAIGRPLSEVFPHVSEAFIQQLVGTPADGSSPTNLRGMLPGGAAWSLDAIRLGPDRVLVMAEELGEAVSSRQRLEALLAAMNAVWRPIDFSSMPAKIVEQARNLITDADAVLCVVGSEEPHGLRIVASSGEPLRRADEAVPDDSLAWQAARSGEPVEVTLPTAHPVLTPELQPQGARAVRAVPFTLSGQVADGRAALAVLVLIKAGATPFTDAERRLIDEFGRLAALAMHRAELVRNARDSARRLQLTLDLAMALASSLSPREVVQLLLNRTLDAVAADRATLSRIEDDEIVIEATYARSGELTWVGRRYALDYIEKQPLIKRALQTRQPVLGGQLDVASAAPEFHDALTAVAQTANVPLLLGGRPAGLLVVSRTQGSSFTSADLGVLELMGNAAMLSLRNARLFEDLEAASAAKSQFLNMAAHELRTPVTVIRGYTSILKAGGARDGTESDRALSMIEQKSRELAKLVDSLLVAARVESGAVAPELTRFDILESVSEAAARGEGLAKLAGGSIKTVLPPGDLPVVANPEQAGRVLDNLINNAIAYSDGAPAIEVKVTTDADTVSIDVCDEGCGIDPSHHEAVFDEFYRVETRDREPTPGAGLGLFISRRLARSMGGELTILRSAPGEGSVFRFRLPRGDAE